MAGIIDVNVNLQNDSKENWEGFEYGTCAAASGGVTTIVDLPVMKKPLLISPKNLNKHLEDAKDNLKVDMILLAYLSE
jgi:allantoinase